MTDLTFEITMIKGLNKLTFGELDKIAQRNCTDFKLVSGILEDMIELFQQKKENKVSGRPQE